MKVLTINSSPRLNSNSTTLAKYFEKEAYKNGAQIESFNLNQLNYRGCQGCMSCKNEVDHCILEDDLSEVLDKMYDADIIVLSSPNYYGHINGQLKSFLDRTFSLLTPQFMTGPDRCRLPEEKDLVFIFTQSSDDDMFGNVSTYMKEFANIYEFEKIHIIKGGNLRKAGDVEDDHQIIERTVELAAELTAPGEQLRLVQ